MNKVLLVVCSWITGFISPHTVAQRNHYTVANAHSHNDYLHPQPFLLANQYHFGSMEADIFPVEGKLCVAHSKQDIQSERTLTVLYLQPLLVALSADPSRKLKLLIDVKENYKEALSLLDRELQPLLPFLTLPGKFNQVMLLISGQRPPPGEYRNYPTYFFFDDDLKLPHTSVQWERVGQVSLPFPKFSTWKGEGKISKEDGIRIRNQIDSVHAAGKTFRFWAAPDTKTSWQFQRIWKADLIGTDKIEELARFLNGRN